MRSFARILSVSGVLLIGASIAPRAASAQAWDEEKPLAPSAAEQAAARSDLETMYAAKIKAASTPEAKAQLADEILDDPRQHAEGSPAYFVRTEMARDLATDADDPYRAIAAVEAAREVFWIDASSQRAKCLEQFLDHATKRHRSIVNFAVFFAEMATADGAVESARRFMLIAADAASRSGDDRLAAQVADRNRSIEKRLDAEKPVERQSDSHRIQNPFLDMDSGFACRSTDYRKISVLYGGGSRETERAVVAALYWLAHHQMKEGNWSLKDYLKMCKDRSCAGPGSEESLAAATAMGLLPYLATGQSHVSNGPFQKNIAAGIYWLISHQKANGDLSANSQLSPHTWMYSHGMATIAICECYGMSHDKIVRGPAQKAIDFIQAAQNQTTGGWRYSPGDEGDTSVLGWQLMALDAGQRAGLKVDPAALDGAKKWLKSVTVTVPPQTTTFGYRPGVQGSPTMTAVGLLCNQHLRVERTDPLIDGSVKLLMANQPDEQNNRNIYYWYYATQAMHNMGDRDWTTWNRKMRKILVASQNREGCAMGSWDPDKPARDQWGQMGGRVMMTSLACLTLEVYYRYPPVYGFGPIDSSGSGGKSEKWMPLKQ